MMRLVLVIVGCLTLGYRIRAVDVIFGYEDPSQNKFKNWGFESNLSNNDWIVSGAKVTIAKGAYSGHKCLMVENRTELDSGVSQTVQGLKQNTNYYVSAFVKLLSDNTDGDGFTKFTLFCKVGNAKYTLAVLPFQKVEKLWKHIGGDFKVLSGGEANCWIRVQPQNVTYEVDATSFIELRKQSNWKRYFDEKIRKLRTSSLRIKGRLPSSCSPSHTILKIQLKRHQFGFGTAIKARQFVGTSQVEVNYRNFILKHFNWVVFENAMKWRQMESTSGNINYNTVDKAMVILKDNNMTIRGHAFLWNVMSRNPDWVQHLTGTALKDAAFTRIKYMTKHYKDEIAEWDVCNEVLHQHFFEKKCGYKDLLVYEFKTAHKYDANSKLFLNDYEIARNGRLTSAIADLAEFLNKRKAYCGGIGIQSHLRIVPIDEEVLKKRVQIAGRLNLPVTITEFSVHSTDVQTRANALDTAFRVYFADPNVHAILLWGFADQFPSFANDFYLTEGTNFTPNVAGQKLLNLIHKEWSTKKDIRPTNKMVDVTISEAFRGIYKLTAVCDGQIKVEKEFYVGDAPTIVNF